MREKRSDYFENSRRATLVQQQYARRNPEALQGIRRELLGHHRRARPRLREAAHAQEASSGSSTTTSAGEFLSDPTTARWRPGRSPRPCPSRRRSSCRRSQHFREAFPEVVSADGLLTSFNPTFDAGDGSDRGWLCPYHYGLDQGPVALMIENYRSGLLWNLMRACPAITTGLRRAGFREWLAERERPMNDAPATSRVPSCSPAIRTTPSCSPTRARRTGPTRQPARRYNLVVIGGGTAGLVTAVGAAGLGAKVALVERNLLGGDCLNNGCVPSKALLRSARFYADLRYGGPFAGTATTALARRISPPPWSACAVCAPTSVTTTRRSGCAASASTSSWARRAFVDGRTRSAVAGARLAFKKAVIATGTHAARPRIAGCAEAGYLTNETVFNLTERPRRLLGDRRRTRSAASSPKPSPASAAR